MMNKKSHLAEATEGLNLHLSQTQAPFELSSSQFEDAEEDPSNQSYHSNRSFHSNQSFRRDNQSKSSANVVKQSPQSKVNSVTESIVKKDCDLNQSPEPGNG